ncbi:MAG: hypothetical protein WBD20_22625 [Pirellulaceae bacterium]
MKHILRLAMQDSDNYVIEMDYCDASGQRTRRTVSPIRFVGTERFLGLCLCREAPRQFQLSRCENLRLIPATDVLMPVPMFAEVSAAGMSAAGMSAGEPCLV